jgi:hypothetical protein
MKRRPMHPKNAVVLLWFSTCKKVLMRSVNQRLRGCVVLATLCSLAQGCSSTTTSLLPSVDGSVNDSSAQDASQGDGAELSSDVGLDGVAPLGDASTDSTTDSSLNINDGSTDSSLPVNDSATTDAANTLPPFDAGNPFGDTGSLGSPDWVTVDVRVDGSKCPAFNACGGSELGTWDVSGGCFEVPIPSAFFSCPGAKAEVVTKQARGRVTFQAGFAQRIAQSEVSANVVLPALCATAVGGCANFYATVKASAPESSCSTDTAGNCTCLMRQITQINDNDAYSTSGESNCLFEFGEAVGLLCRDIG